MKIYTYFSQIGILAHCAHYSNRKSSNAGLIYLHSINYGVCLFTVTVRYSVVQFVIQIVKIMNIGLIHLYRIHYRDCVFTFTVCYLVSHFVI